MAKGKGTQYSSLFTLHPLCSWIGLEIMKLKMQADKQSDPRTGVSPAQDFRGQMISGEKVAQSYCCLCELLLAALSSSSFFFLQMYQLIMLSGNLNVVGMACSLAVPHSNAQGRTAGGVCVVARLACGQRQLWDTEPRHCLIGARLCTLQLLQEWEDESQKRGVTPGGGF